MNSLLLVVIASVGAILLWGLLAPRSLWRALASWSYRNPHRDEPSGAAYAAYRAVALLGIGTMLLSGFFVYRHIVDSQPHEAPPPSAVERMWGTPKPVVLNRVITSAHAAPKDLVNQPILGYQGLDGQTRQPPYLFSLDKFALKGATAANGLIGTKPQPGLVALDTARLVVLVKGDPKCFPHAAVVDEGSKTVTVAIYYGRAKPKDGANKEQLADCSTLALENSVPTLIPLTLSAPLDNRLVLTPNGERLRQVDVLQ